MTTGERIKALRVAHGMSQEELGAKIGLQKAAIYKYEKGLVVNLKRDVIGALAKALDVRPSYLLGLRDEDGVPFPTIAEDTVSIPILGTVAAGYDHFAETDNMVMEQVDVPKAWLKGRSITDFFALRVVGNSMYPMYIDGDTVIVLRQSTLNRSGEIGVVIYGDECATLKKVEYVAGEDWMLLLPVNPSFEPIRVTGEALEHCRVLGVPKILIREIGE